MKTKLEKYLLVSSLLVTTLITGCDNNSTTESSDVDKSVAQQKVAAPTIDMHSAVLSNNLEALKQHILAGSDINVKDPFGGSSPLISAALFGKTDMVKVLLNANAKIDFQNNDASTALFTAAFFGRTEVVEILLKSGADKTIKNSMGLTAYESVIGPFEDVKPIYDMLLSSLAPMGLKLDYEELKLARPQIAKILK